MPQKWQSAEDVKQDLISYLAEEGYGTYARRLSKYRFVLADKIGSHYIRFAAMIDNDKLIVLNPALLDNEKMAIKTVSPSLPARIRKAAQEDDRDAETKKMEQLSVLIRHELLHFLLVHSKRAMDHLSKKHPEWLNIFSRTQINRIENIAGDYEISLRGYDAHDKHVVDLMTTNNEVFGGLIAEEDHPEWGNKTLEEMMDLLADEIAAKNKAHKPKTKIVVQRDSHSPEYVKMYNEILHLLDDKKYSDGDLANLLSQAMADEDVVDTLLGNILLKKGE